jgi:hypothetical protein
MDDLVEGVGGCLFNILFEVLAYIASALYIEVWSSVAGELAASLTSNRILQAIIWGTVFFAPCPICGGVIALIGGAF